MEMEMVEDGAMGKCDEPASDKGMGDEGELRT